MYSCTFTGIEKPLRLIGATAFLFLVKTLILFIRILTIQIIIKTKISMPKCQMCLKNDVSFKELFNGKDMCSECEQNGLKVPIIRKIRGFLIVFGLCFVVFQCTKTPKNDASEVERVELPNGQVQFNVGSGKKDNVKEITEEKTESETTLSQIPNVVSYEIYAPFVKMGFNDLGKDFSVGSCFWTYDLVTERGTFYLRIFGKNPNEIQQIDASLTGGNTNGVKAYFIAVAKTVYKGSDFNEASRFINKNVNRDAETRIGGVRLRLTKGKFNALTIGVNDDF